MNLKKRLSKEVGVVGFVFAVLFLIITGTFFQFSTSVNDVITQSEPALNALDLMLLDSYDNHILLGEYLDTSTYADSLKVLQRLSEGSLKSDSFEQSLRQAISNDVITDETLIANYQNAISLFEQVQSFRTQLIALHERELVSNVYTSTQKRQVESQYNDLFAQATTEFRSQIATLDAENQLARDRLVIQSRIYALLIASLLLICIGTIVYAVRRLSKRIIGPLDETIDATKEFVLGKYDLQLNPTTSITEILDLQENINAVFRAVNKVAKSDDSQRKSIQQSLLKQEYVAILEYLGQKQSANQKVTMRDIKKEFNITHPTALTRIKYLEENGYLVIEKDGRDKCLLLA